ncbi:hypothetical protein KQX54_020623 [Cotesia glomerata]|uniref:Uncharacterized protein n=1 Tax=Cotesia glomerata TaxID=32391 RepID=A0AAV7J8F4_COTGL|nr:hypothetical protein KQX54_020623 [Cotesia glomerata]
MIDWVSIVRHSRRRFSDYVNAVPMKIRKRRRKNPMDLLYVSSTDDKNSVGYYERLCGLCICCRKIRYATRNVDEQLPPPPSPPQIKEAVQLDGVSRPSSVERVIHSEISPHISANHDTHKLSVCSNVVLSIKFRIQVTIQNLATRVEGLQPRTCNWYRRVNEIELLLLPMSKSRSLYSVFCSTDLHESSGYFNR